MFFVVVVTDDGGGEGACVVVAMDWACVEQRGVVDLSTS